MNPESSPKLCECGCEKPTTISNKTSKHWGWRKGEPKRFCKGHAHPNRRIWDQSMWQEEDRGYLSMCWIWLLAKDKLGYGRFTNRSRVGTSGLAHVEAYIREFGPVPDGVELDHLCRITSCVNPFHLEPVPHGENLRRGKGAKLSYDIANEIRERRKQTGETYIQLAEAFDVEKRTIWAIITNRRWTPH